MNSLAHAAVNQYQKTNNSVIALSDPHVLILRMLDGAIERIFQAKGAINQKNSEDKGKFIGKAIGIISGLDACLNRELENDLVGNLGALYEYANMRLLEASVENDTDRLDEVAKLIGGIRSAWALIPEEAKAQHSRENG